MEEERGVVREGKRRARRVREDRDHSGLQSLKYFLYDPLQKRFADSGLYTDAKRTLKLQNVRIGRALRVQLVEG